MTTLALIPAAGSGTRLAAGMPKAFVDVGGRTIVERAVDGLRAAGVEWVVVAVPPDLVGHTRTLLPDVTVVAGGSVRSDSVRACLAGYADGADDRPEPNVVLIHDAARALTPPQVFTRVITAVQAGAPVVVPAVAVTDTLKQVDSHERVVATVDRTPLRAIQTPQGFAPDALARAHAAAGDATDDAGLAEALGMTVQVVPGDSMSFKITTEWDLRLARMLVDAQRTHS